MLVVEDCSAKVFGDPLGALEINTADENKPSNEPRSENLQLHRMLLDEPPGIEASSQSMGRNFIRHMFELDNYAWALAGVLIYIDSGHTLYDS